MYDKDKFSKLELVKFQENPTQFKNPENQKGFFKILIWIVFVYIIFYALVYYFLQAKFSALVLVVGVLFFTSLILYLEKLNRYTSARLIFIASAVYYIYVGPLGVPFNLRAEVYYIPAMMLSLFLFDVRKKKEIAIGMSLPLVGWGLSVWGPVPELSPNWIPQKFPVELIQIANFLGAFLITVIFLNQYSRYLLGLKESVAKELEHSKKMKRLLEEAQRLSKIGNWEFDLITKDLFWSKEQYRIFEVEKTDKSELYNLYRSRFHPEDLSKLDAVLEKTLKSGEGSSFEHRILGKDGSVKYVFCRMQVFKNEKGEAVRLFGTGQDITEQKRSIELIHEQQHKLVTSAKMASLGEMAGGLAHEINNPLSIIHSLIFRLNSTLNSGEIDIEKVHSDLNKIDMTVERIAKIVKGLKSFSRNAELDPKQMADLKQIIDDVFELCQERIRLGGIEMKINIPADIKINCRPTQICQVLLNLISNAVDAVMELNEKWITINATVNADKIMIEVVDSGSGIPAQIAEKIMQPFFTTKEVGKGIGLGLSISLGIIQDHNGKLNYDPTSKNTSFKIELPKT